MSGNHNSGRKKKSWKRAAVAASMAINAKEAAGYIKACLSGKIKESDIDWKMINLCEFCINHELGLPRARTELTGKDGQAISYNELVAIATQSLMISVGHNGENEPLKVEDTTPLKLASAPFSRSEVP